MLPAPSDPMISKRPTSWSPGDSGTAESLRHPPHSPEVLRQSPSFNSSNHIAAAIVWPSSSRAQLIVNRGRVAAAQKDAGETRRFYITYAVCGRAKMAIMSRLHIIFVIVVLIYGGAQ